jgi:cell division protease FtsH
MTTGASNDLFRATQLASRVVRKFGMGNFTYVTTNTDEQMDPEGLLIREENQAYINREIKDIIENAENEIRHIFYDDEWRKMLKESALYLCENSAMSKEKMKEIYDKVSDSVKMSVRSNSFYHDAIMNI